jgi:putative membrane protein
MKSTTPKIPVSHLLLACALASLPLAVSRAEDTPTTATVAEGEAASTHETAKAEKSMALSEHETMFVKKASAGNAAEVKMGELAQSNAESQEVKDFGSQMVKDHGQANMDLEPIAKSHEIAFPAEASEKQKMEYDKLSQLKGAAFDKAYIADAVEDHTKVAKEYQMEQTSVKDPALKAYAEKVTPIVEMHLKMAKELHAKMSGLAKS